MEGSSVKMWCVACGSGKRQAARHDEASSSPSGHNTVRHFEMNREGEKMGKGWKIIDVPRKSMQVGRCLKMSALDCACLLEWLNMVEYG